MDTKALRQKILDLAIRGKLVPQDPNDEPASVLLERIRAEKERLIAEGKIKRPKKPKTPSSESHYQNLPNGWSECKIEDVAKTLTDFVASGSFASLRENVKYYDSPNYAILVRTKDLGNSFKRGLVYTDKHGYDFLSNSNLYGGELILPNIGASIGKVFLMPKIEAPTTLAPNSIMIRCWEEPTLKWLYLLFQSTLGQNILASISASTAQGKFNKTDLRDVIIPLPPLYEQERILTQADRLLEYVEKINTDKTDLTNILNSAKSKILELAMQGKLVPQDPADEPAADMLRRVNPKARIITDNPHSWNIPNSWVWTQMGDVFLHNTGKALNNSNSEGTLYEYITTSNVYWGRFELDILKKMPFKDSEIDKCKIAKGDLLVCEGGDVGRAAIWKYDMPMMIQNHLHRLRPLSIDVLPEFYFYVLKMFKDKDLIGGKGIALQGFSSNALHKLVVPLPSIREQKHIVIKIEELWNVLEEIEASLQS